MALQEIGTTKVIHTAKVVKAGSTLIVPIALTYHNAIEVLQRQIEHEEKITSVSRTFNVFPWEGALALKKAMIESFGVFTTQNTPSFFGSNPPKEVTINTGYGTTTTVPWGRFQWPFAEKEAWTSDVKEFIESSTNMHKGRLVFQVAGQVRVKWMDTFNKLMDRVAEIAKAEPLYKGKPVRIAFTTDAGVQIPLPEPEFMDLSKFKIEDIVYSKSLETLIEANIMTPLRHTQACRDAGIPLKRGVLAAGPYGTGKSLLAQAVGKVGVDNGWTFLYIKNASELPHAIRFAEAYQPCVIFAEDIDRAAEGSERTEAIDEILNTLDGIDTKSSEIMVILTTNHLDTVNPAMRRPGRLDVVLNIEAPDAEAASRLVLLYGRGRIAENSDLREVGRLLEGCTPAVIREVVERAKLATIMRTGKADSVVLAEDLEVSGHTMVEQQKLLAPIVKDRDDVASPLVRRIAEEVRLSLRNDLVENQSGALTPIAERR